MTGAILTNIHALTLVIIQGKVSAPRDNLGGFSFLQNGNLNKNAV
jgi:hypothetical protein